MVKQRPREFRPYRVAFYILFFVICAYLVITIVASIFSHLWLENDENTGSLQTPIHRPAPDLAPPSKAAHSADAPADDERR